MLRLNVNIRFIMEMLVIRNIKERTEKVIDDLQAQITIRYNHWPKLNDRETQDRLGDVAKADYCAYTGDDDFLIPDSLSKCA